MKPRKQQQRPAGRANEIKVFKSPEKTEQMKPETSEQIAIYGIKLHLNVRI